MPAPDPDASDHPGDSDSPLTDDQTPQPPPAGRLFGRWYYDSYTVPYNENRHWATFFDTVADAIVTQLGPRTVLDAGCAKGFLVAALRERDVEAYGFDVSEVAIAEANEAVRPYLRVGSLTESIDGHYDLVTCIEVMEHLDPADATVAVANLCQASGQVLLSSTPGDHDEPTHVNVQPPERWAALFASQDFFRDFRHDASYLSPWAALYRRDARSAPDIVYEYDRAWSQLRAETIEQRRALIDLQDRFERLHETVDRKELDRLAEDREALRKEVLRLRDAVIGKDAELGTALGRVAELESFLERYNDMEKRLNAVLTSTSWRLMWAVGTPVRKLREKGPGSNDG